MSFSISIIDAKDEYGMGRILLGGFSEEFELSFQFWKAFDYQKHWSESIRRVVDDELDSCLITSITDPATANFFFWWPIYRISNEKIAVQNQIFFLDECHHAFDITNPYLHIRPRRTTSDEGCKISEWQVPIASLCEWMKNFREWQ